MRRVQSAITASLLVGDRTAPSAVSSSSSLYGSPSTSSSAPVSSITTFQARFLRNLHNKRQERNKSLVKNRHAYSRKWYLEMGNNFELMEEKGHEREAFQNFVRYRTDWGLMTIPRYVSDATKLPPMKRFDLYYNIVQERKGLSLYQKNKYLLECLECFVEMKALGEIKAKYDEWDTIFQNHFLYACDEIIKNSTKYSKTQHSAVASVIRAAAICDELDCKDKRAMCLNAAEGMAKSLDQNYFFNRPKDEPIPLSNPWASEAVTSKSLDLQKKEERFQRFPGKMYDIPDRSFQLRAYPMVPYSKAKPYFTNKHLRNVHREIE